MIDVNSSYPLQTQGFYKSAPVEAHSDKDDQQADFTAVQPTQLAAQAGQNLLTGKNPNLALSTAVTDLLLLEQEKPQGRKQLSDITGDTASDKEPILVNTSKGKISLDDYFNSDIKYTDIGDVPLMTPSRHNVEQLTAYVGDKMKAMMTAHHIPEHPSSFHVNAEGDIIVPGDYAYKEEFIKALEADKNLKKQVDSLNGLTGQYAGLQAAAHKAGHADVDQDVLLALLEGEQTGEHPNVSFGFKPDGSLNTTINGINLQR